MKMQNDTSKIRNIVAASFAIGLLVLSPMTLFHNISAQESTVTGKDIMKNLPSLEISESVKTKAIQIALSDQNVQKQIHGRNAVFMDSDWTGEIYNSTYMTAYPEIHFKVGDKSQLGVIVDTQNNKVRKFLEAPIVKASYTGPQFAEDQYTGSTTIDGIGIHLTLPSYTPTTNMDNHLVFIVNAVEKNAPNDANRCVSTHYTDHYFAQSGMYYTSTGKYDGWADTLSNCSFMAATGMPYVNGHHADFQIFVDGASWVMYGIDDDVTTMPHSYFLKSRTGINNNTLQTSDPGTSVWLENWNSNTNWYSAFSSTSLSTTAVLTSDGSTTWFNWDAADTKKDFTCSGNWGTDNDISGNLQSGGTATWNIQTMAQSHAKC